MNQTAFGLLFILIIFILFWSYSGYIIFLFLLSQLKENEKSRKSLPSFVSLVIPVLNEGKIIEQKIKNILSLNLPSNRFEIVFVDGGSADKTIKIIKKISHGCKGVRIVKTKLMGKIPQINSVLNKLLGEVVVVTDADGIMDKKSLTNLLNEFADRKVGVVGSLVVPSNSIPLERQYWRTQNRMRLLESLAHSSSIVIASCYAFRKKILSTFPEDVIADDVYIAFKANFAGYKTLYPDSAITYEIRTPQTLKDWVHHKTRKGHAFIKELLRFLPMIGKGPVIWQITYLTKCLQFLVVPSILSLLPFLILISLKFIRIDYLFYSLIFLFITLLIANRIMTNIRGDEKGGENWPLVVLAFIFSNLILFVQLWHFPFYKQTSSYERLKQ